MPKLNYMIESLGEETPVNKGKIKFIANTIVMLCMVTAFIVSPMPSKWINDETKVYILTVTSSLGGMFKGVEKLTKENKAKEDEES